MSKNLCPICLNPKSGESAGRLTQWIVACTCDVLKPDVDEHSIAVSICRECGKRIGEGRSGSFTQYIFRFDICQCRNPSPVESTAPKPSEDHYYADGGDEPELEIESGKFPEKRFKPLSKLGSGAVGTVYLAKDRLLEKLVAVKVLSIREPRLLAAFQEEARAISNLRHPSIVSLLDFGLTDAEVPYMVLEHVPGSSMEQFLTSEGTMDWRVARDVFAQVCSALEYLHTQGILHRDIKPSNILLFRNDRGTLDAKLIDFGIAKSTQQRSSSAQFDTMVGTPLYMSPDTGLGRPYDARSEIYSLSCVLFEALSGSTPFRGENAMATLVMHAEQEAPPLCDLVDIVIPKSLEALVAKALAKDPTQRFQSMADMRAAILAVEPELRETVTRLIVKKADSSKRLLIPFVALLTIALVSPLVYIKIAGDRDAQKIRKQLAQEKAKPAPIGSSEELERTFEVDGRKELGMTGGKWENESPGKFIGHVVTDEDFRTLKDKDVVSLEITPESAIDLQPERALTGVGFKYLVNKPIADVFIQLDTLSDAGVCALAELKSISRLEIRYATGLSSTGIASLSKMENLRQCLLRFIPGLPPNTIELLSKSKSINKLDLGHSQPISAKDLKFLSRFKNLRILELTATDLDDDAVRMLAGARLEELCIKENDVSSDALLALAKNKSLRLLTLSKSSRISQDAIDKFKRLRPNCFVDVKEAGWSNSLP